MNATTFGLDIAKNVFFVHGTAQSGKVVVSRSRRRAQVLSFFSNAPAALIGIEACAGSHYWARELIRLGHTVKLLPAQYVRRYVQGNKTDAHDAAAIAEAVRSPRIQAVAINTPEQQDMQMLHRIRRRLVEQRCGLMAQIRGLLGEYGIVFPQGPGKLRRGLAEMDQSAPPTLSVGARELFLDLQTQWQELDKRIAGYDKRVAQACRTNALAQRIDALPGIGVVTATALVAAVGNAVQFPSGRHLASNLGLTPREHSSGGKQTLLGIHKGGNAYVRMLLIHGARTVLRHGANKTDPLTRWALGLQARKGMNVATVALANKLARICWAVLARDRTYQSHWQNA